MRGSERAPREVAIETYRAAERALERGERATIATVIRAAGSTPRGPGARMAVLRDGSIHESVGGGACEHMAAAAALGSLASGRPEIVRADMSGTGDSGMVCGGSMEVLVEPLDPARDTAWVRTIVRLRGEGQAVWVLRRLVESLPAESRVLIVASADGRAAWSCGETAFPALPENSREAAIRFFGESDPRGPYVVETIPPVDRLVIVGGGHIGRALCEIGSLLQFEVTVVDERPDFAGAERFPSAAGVLCGDPGEALGRLAIGPGAYYVLVGHGYPSDLRALRVLAGRETAYIGMIGSRRRVETVLRALAEEGIDPRARGRFFAPIGLDLGARTPEEIAISIAAEIVAVRNGLGRDVSTFSHRRDPK